MEENKEEQLEEAVEEPKKKRKRKKIWEVTPENDMKYRGPLSYRTLSILGWLCLAFGQAVIAANLIGKATHSPSDQVFSVRPSTRSLLHSVFRCFCFRHLPYCLTGVASIRGC